MIGKPLCSHDISFLQINNTEGGQDEHEDLSTTLVGIQMGLFRL